MHITVCITFRGEAKWVFYIVVCLLFWPARLARRSFKFEKCCSCSCTYVRNFVNSHIFVNSHTVWIYWFWSIKSRGLLNSKYYFPYPLNGQVWILCRSGYTWITMENGAQYVLTEAAIVLLFATHTMEAGGWKANLASLFMLVEKPVGNNSDWLLAGTLKQEILG